MLCTVKLLQNKRWKNMKETRNYWRLFQCWCVQLKQSITVFAVTCWSDNNYKILIFHNVYSQNMLTSSFVDCSDTSVTSSLSETKGFFCFWFNKPLEKCLFSHTEYLKKEANVKGKKHAEHCLTHQNKTTCEIWSVFDKVHFWVKYLTPFLYRNLQFLCSELTHSKQTTFSARIWQMS